MKKIAYMFPGQGSQVVGMGKDFYEANESIQVLYENANRSLNKDIKRIMFEGPNDELTQTENAQPALLLSSIAAVRRLSEEGVEPSMTVGHSLGEYSALVASGSLELTDALKLVQTRGRLMEEAYPKGQGTMAAVLGLDYEEIQQTLSFIDEVVDIANLNCPGQIVISGSQAGIEKAETALIETGARRVVRLNVSGPFHSRLMKEANDAFSNYLNAVDLQAAKYPVYANVTAKPVTSETEIIDLLLKQLYSPVRFEESIINIKKENIDAIVEVGEGRVLSGLVRKIDRKIKTFSVSDEKSLEKFIRWYKGEA